MPRRPLSQAEVVARIEAAYPGEYGMSKLVYKHSYEKFVVICAKHKEFEMNVVRLRQAIDGKKPLCPYCNGEVFFEEALYREELREYTWPKKLAIVAFFGRRVGKYSEVSRWVKLKHICGHSFDRRVERVRAKGFMGCPVCTTRRSPIASAEDFIARVKETGNPNIVFPDLVWGKMEYVVTGYCCKHEKRVVATAKTFIHGNGCHACNKENRDALKERFGKIKEKQVGEGK
jgi:hypothetical protein